MIDKIAETSFYWFIGAEGMLHALDKDIRQFRDVFVLVPHGIVGEDTNDLVIG